MNDRLNYFNPYENKRSSEEETITRALFAILRLVPLARVTFFNLVKEYQFEHDFDRQVADITSLKETPEFSVETSQIGIEGGSLFSVLITNQENDPRENNQEIKVVDRNPRYDGVITHKGESIIVENKPDASDVKHRQLCPGKTSMGSPENFDIQPELTVISWQKLLTRLIHLDKTGEFDSTGSRLINDLIEHVYEERPTLHPYREFSLCGENERLLDLRCKNALQEIFKNYEYKFRHQPKEWIAPNPDKLNKLGVSAVKEFGIEAEPKKGTMDITLKIKPGDNVTQARNLYKKIKVVQVIQLEKQTQWSITPNLHFASAWAENLIWASPEMNLREYITVWKEDEMPFGQVGTKTFKESMLNRFLTKGLISNEDKEEFDREFFSTGRSKINICPGISLSYAWNLKETIEMDEKSQFISEVKNILNDALSCWNEKLEF